MIPKAYIDAWRSLAPWNESSQVEQDLVISRLPRISSQNYNAYLKEIAVRCEIRKSLSSHCARHTFATRMLNKGVPLKNVSHQLGHSSVRQTEHYARISVEQIKREMKEKGF
mgnify:CR=1 FL=1